MRPESLALYPDVLLTAFWAIVCGAFIVKAKVFRSFGIDRRLVLGIFVLKLLAGAVLWVVYTYYFPYRGTSDNFRYFDDAMHLHSYLFSEPAVWFRFFLGVGLDDPALASVHEGLRSWQSAYSYGIANDNPGIVRINMLFRLISGGAYGVHVVFMCFLALIGHLLLVRGLQIIAQSLAFPSLNINLLLIGTALFPTVLFWSSSVLKEVPLVLGMGLLILGIARLYERKMSALLSLLPAIWLLVFMKPYVLVTFLPILLGWLVHRFLHIRPIAAFPSAIVFCYLLAVNASGIYPPGDLLYILHKKQVDFYNVANAHEAGSTVEISPVNQHWLGFIADVPERLAMAYLRPHPLEAEGALQWAASFENLLFLSGLLWLFYYFFGFPFFRRPNRADARRATHKNARTSSHFTGTRGKWMQVHICGRKGFMPIMFWMVIGFMITFGVVAGSTVPVMGAMVRYKLPILLFFGPLIAATFTKKVTQPV